MDPRGRIREFMRNELTPLVDRIEQDGLGGILGVRDSKEEDAPHYDCCTHGRSWFHGDKYHSKRNVQSKSFGGWNPYVNISPQRFTLITRKGDYPVFLLQSHPFIARSWWSTSG